MHVGYDIKTPDPGEFEEMFCETCKEKMNVERNIFMATSFSEAMAKKDHICDKFVCPNAGLDWHEQVISLLKEKKKTASKTISDILDKDIADILNNRKI